MVTAQRHVSHHLARWLNLLAEYLYRVVHIPGRSNAADFLTPKHFRDGSRPASSTGYDEADSQLDLFSAPPAATPNAAFVHFGGAPTAPRFLPRSHSAPSTQTVPLAAPPRRLAAPSYAAMACGTFEVLAVAGCVFQRQGGSV